MKLEIQSLSKKYRGDVWGLRDFSLETGPGILGLVGPNGAGKSTLMRILATVMLPTKGCVTWNGVDILKNPDGLRSVLGYLPQDFGVYPHLNAVEFLVYIAALKGLDLKFARKRIDELLRIVGLIDVRKRPLGDFSGGMKKRIGIAQALLNDPELLIVDEPTSGLDPEERVRFRNLLALLSANRIVILSTHIVSDIEAVAAEIAVLNQGHLLKYCSPEALIKDVEDKIWEIVVPSTELASIRKQMLISSVVRRGDGVHLRLVADDPPSSDAIPRNATLEDAYLYCLENNREIIAS
jgi:ABC-type multidrug transport system ATPase subunit